MVWAVHTRALCNAIQVRVRIVPELSISGVIVQPSVRLFDVAPWNSFRLAVLLIVEVEGQIL